MPADQRVDIFVRPAAMRFHQLDKLGDERVRSLCFFGLGIALSPGLTQALFPALCEASHLERTAGDRHHVGINRCGPAPEPFALQLFGLRFSSEDFYRIALLLHARQQFVRNICARICGVAVLRTVVVADNDALFRQRAKMFAGSGAGHIQRFSNILDVAVRLVANKDRHLVFQG